MTLDALAVAGVTSKVPVGFDTSKSSPFSLPLGLKMPKIQKYDWTSGPRNHLATFTMDALPYQYDNGLTIYLFFKSLKGEALKRFNTLMECDLDDFKTVQEKFLNQYSHCMLRKPTI